MNLNKENYKLERYKFHFSCDVCDSGNTEYEYLEDVGFDVRCNDCGFKKLRKPNPPPKNFNINNLKIIDGGKPIAMGHWKEYQNYKNLGRNNKCGCGSGKKYKKCCINRDWKNYK